jgi:hypothetical protein
MGSKVTLHTILLGVGGTCHGRRHVIVHNLPIHGIYHACTWCTHVKEGAYSKLANELNLVAAEYAERAMALRRFLVHTEQKNQGTPSTDVVEDQTAPMLKITTIHPCNAHPMCLLPHITSKPNTPCNLAIGMGTLIS